MQARFHLWRVRFQKSFPDQFHWLLVGIFGISFLAWFFTTQTPEQGSGIIAIGIFALTVTMFCFLQFLFNNVRRSILLCFGGATFFTLRALKLNDPLYIILLILFLVSIELSTRNK